MPLDDKQRKRTRWETDRDLAPKRAKLIWAEMLTATHLGPARLQPSPNQCLQAVANSLWERQQRKIAQGEIHKDENEKNHYVYERHVEPFGKTAIKDIDADALERFRYSLPEQELGKSSRLDCMNLVMVLRKEVQRKAHIASGPIRINEGNNRLAAIASTNSMI